MLTHNLTPLETPSEATAVFEPTTGDAGNEAIVPTAFPQQALSFPLEHLVHNWYWQSYHSRPNDLPEVANGYGMLLLDNWNGSTTDSPLQLAISAASHALFGRCKNFSDARSIASVRYTQALVKTQEEINNLSSESIDQLLLTISLLTNFENMTHGQEFPRSSDVAIDLNHSTQLTESMAHHNGIIALLSFRQRNAPSHDQEPRLDKLVRRQLIRTAILQNIPLPPWLHDGRVFGETGLALDLDQCAIGVIELRSQAKELLANVALQAQFVEDTTHSRVMKLVGKAVALGFRLLAWKASLPADWAYHVHSATSESIRAEYLGPHSQPMHAYSTVGHAAVWNRYRTFAIIAHDTVLDLLMLSPRSLSNSETRMRYIRTTVRQLADEICATLPYQFNVLDKIPKNHEHALPVLDFAQASGVSISPQIANLVSWPLTIAMSAASFPEPHRHCIKSYLRIASQLTGDGVLQAVAGTEI